MRLSSESGISDGESRILAHNILPMHAGQDPTDYLWNIHAAADRLRGILKLPTDDLHQVRARRNTADWVTRTWPHSSPRHRQWLAGGTAGNFIGVHSSFSAFLRMPRIREAWLGDGHVFDQDELGQWCGINYAHLPLRMASVYPILPEKM